MFDSGLKVSVVTFILYVSQAKQSFRGYFVTKRDRALSCIVLMINTTEGDDSDSSFIDSCSTNILHVVNVALSYGENRIHVCWFKHLVEIGSLCDR